MLKNIFDKVLALLLLPVAILVCLPALMFIRLESPGNPLFVQQRVGQNRRCFSLIKLRTMAKGTANLGSHEVSPGQLTRSGSFLRRTKVDELPQIWNVLIGHMSFVGPRPCLPNQEHLIKERDMRGVFAARPGITGSAQVAGIDMSTPEKLAIADAAYITNRSFLGDLKLIIQTGTGSGRGDALKND